MADLNKCDFLVYKRSLFCPTKLGLLALHEHVVVVAAASSGDQIEKFSPTLHHVIR